MVNGLIIKVGYKLKNGDEIILNFEVKEEINLLKFKNIDLNIVYEDDDIMVINKFKGLVVYFFEIFSEIILVFGLLYYIDILFIYNDDFLRLGILYCIDKDILGFILVVKINEVYKILV